MCIRDSFRHWLGAGRGRRPDGQRELLDRPLQHGLHARIEGCLLYTSDAAAERSRVDLGGCRIIKKKK